MTPDRRSETFQTPAPVRLRVELPKGRIRVVAEETAETRIELTAVHGDDLARQWIADAQIEQQGDEVLVRVNKPNLAYGLDIGVLVESLLSLATLGAGGAIEAVVHVPATSAARLSTGSGTIETIGSLGEVSAASGSGVIRLGDCAEARARTGSGDISIASTTGSADAKTGSGKVSMGKVGGHATVMTGSGRTELGEVTGDAKVTAGSGSIEVDRAGDSLEAFTASGKIEIGRVDHGRVRAKTVSGKVSVGVAQGSAALLDISTMSGRVHSELEPSAAPSDGEPQVELVISTMSGNVNVARAPA
ncbi:MAG TPA: DUF4097 family beta strand repeat-containing protein [Caulobacteraceae bacterium]|nr:DUF4097 family beta strand repeat-containing protein [Caulobacteraceae bacterium]